MTYCRLKVRVYIVRLWTEQGRVETKYCIYKTIIAHLENRIMELIKLR